MGSGGRHAHQVGGGGFPDGSHCYLRPACFESSKEKAFLVKEARLLPPLVALTDVASQGRRLLWGRKPALSRWDFRFTQVCDAQWCCGAGGFETQALCSSKRRAQGLCRAAGVPRLPSALSRARRC